MDGTTRMKLFGFLLLSWAAAGQSLTLTGPVRVFAGQSALISIDLVNVAGVDLAGAQWTLPAGSVLPVAQPIVANKSRMCAPSSLTCALFGILPAPVGGAIAPGAVFNALPIASGPVQRFTVPIPAGAHPGDTLMIQLSGVYGASPAGAADDGARGQAWAAGNIATPGIQPVQVA